ncbi:MAG: SH3 domain-containing protein [Burkholderiales bacterium]
MITISGNVAGFQGALALVVFVAATACSAIAADFKSVAENGTVLYDAPSPKAKKLFVVSKDYPVEVMVIVDNWAKVRDPSGDLSWVERKLLSDRRTVVVNVPVVEVRQSNAERSTAVFRAQQGVALELSEIGTDGWAKVRHRDGQSGYLRIKDVWGL